MSAIIDLRRLIIQRPAAIGRSRHGHAHVGWRSLGLDDDKPAGGDIVCNSRQGILRPFKELGGANYGWLDTKHHFSFADYYDPERVHWGALRV